MNKRVGSLVGLAALTVGLLSYRASGKVDPADLQDSVKRLGGAPTAEVSQPALRQAPIAGRRAGYESGCRAYATSTGSREYPRKEIVGDAKKVLDLFFDSPTPRSTSDTVAKDTRYVIALAPDPAHTSLGLLFDRELVSMMEAARDAGYFYDSQWMPWRHSDLSRFEFLADRQRDAELEQQREMCPGVLLFRSSVDTTYKNSYEHSLVIFVVAERPTDGINPLQWSNAIAEIKRLSKGKLVGKKSKTADQRSNRTLEILGPVFSGSLPSVARQLTSSAIAESFTSARVFSGSISNAGAIREFRDHLAKDSLSSTTKNARSSLSVNPAFFSENDELQIQRLVRYLHNKNCAHNSEIAILSEDDTAYAKEQLIPVGSDPAPRLCDLLSATRLDTFRQEDYLQITYPRDISNVREEYRRQSVFDTSFPGTRPLRSILRLESSDHDANDLDTLPEYAGDFSAIDKEARLLGVVDQLRTNHVRYLILRSTNPLDYVFLSRFFHRTYPDAHIITLGSDLLLTREIDNTDFRGDLALTNYPMLARQSAWSTHADKARIVFSGRMAAGQYMAARYLLDNPTSPIKATNKLAVLNSEDLFVVPYPPYSVPSWALSSNEDPFSRNPVAPPTWLVTLGRDGYWPVAVLPARFDSPSSSESSQQQAHVSSTSSTGSSPASTVKPITVAPNHIADFYYSIPLSTKVAICIALLLVIYQMSGLFVVCPSTSASLSFVFHNNYRLRWQAELRGLSCALAILPLYELLLPRLFLFSLSELAGTLRPLWMYWSLLAFLTILMGLLLAHFGSSETSINLPSNLEGDVNTSETIFDFDMHARKRARLHSLYSFAVAIMISILIFFLECTRLDLYIVGGKDTLTLFPLVYRMEHLTSGISPLVPVLLVTMGCYFWIWQVMAANLMIGPGRPELPYASNLFSQNISRGRESFVDIWVAEKNGYTRRGQPISFCSEISCTLGASWKYVLDWMRWTFIEGLPQPLPQPSQEVRDRSLQPQYRRLGRRMGRIVYTISNPFFFADPNMLGIVGIFSLWLGWCVRREWNSLSLEGFRFNSAFFAIVGIQSLLTLLGSYRLYATWGQLRRVLLALNRTRIRSALETLRPISSVSLWTVSTNVHRIQYRLFFQQYDALRRLLNVHHYKDPSSDGILLLSERCGKIIVDRTRSELEKGMAVYWWVPFDKKVDPQCRTIREIYRDAAGYFMKELIGTWETLPGSLFAAHVAAPSGPQMRAEEEFVAAHYMGFIHIVIGRMRTMTVSMALLFVCISFAFAFYPFVPHPFIKLLLLVNFVIIATAVGYVYLAMDRDEVLNLMTQTKPGRIGPELWLRYAGFLVGPILGLFATQYPSLVDTVLGWVQPGAGLGR